MFSLLEKLRASTSAGDFVRSASASNESINENISDHDHFTRKGLSPLLSVPGHRPFRSSYDTRQEGRKPSCIVRTGRAQDASISRLRSWEQNPEIAAFCQTLELINREKKTLGLYVVLYLDHDLMLTAKGFSRLVRSRVSPNLFREEKLDSAFSSETFFRRSDVAQDLDIALTIGLRNYKAAAPNAILSSVKGQRPRIGRLYLMPENCLRKEEPAVVRVEELKDATRAPLR